MNYDRLIMANLKGETPKEKYDSLIEMKRLLQIAGYPRRGTQEEIFDVYQIAKFIQDSFTSENLIIKRLGDI